MFQARFAVASIRATIIGMAALTSAVFAEAAAPVRVADLGDVAVSLEDSAPATVHSLNTTEVAAQVSGVIDAIHVNVGETVQEGSLIAELDCADYQQSLKQANFSLTALKARQRLAEQQLERAKKLLPTRNISEEQANQRQTEFDMVGAEIAAQNAAIQIARRQVSKCRIYSPFTGVVSRRISSQGAFVSPGVSVAEIIDTQRLEISARLNLDLVQKLRDQALRFVSRDQSFPVSIKTILPVVDASSRTREARLVFTGDQALAGTPGRLVWVAVPTAVPAYLVVSREGNLGIFVLDGQKARFVALPDALQGRPAEVSLPAQTKIITDGRHGLADGELVSIVDPE